MAKNKNKRSALFFKPKEFEFICENIEGQPTITCRNPNVLDLIMANADTMNVPQPLVDLVTGEQQSVDTENFKLDRESLPTYRNFAHLLIRASVIWPIIVPDGQEPDYDREEIAISDLGVDTMNLYNRIMEGSAQARNFPEQQDDEVAALPASEDVGDETE